MKYDDKGININKTEHLKNFIEEDDALEYFQRLKNDLPWQEVTWRNSSTFARLVFRYGEFERNFRKHEVLEEIISYIETILETDITNIWCDYYRSGKDYISPQQYTHNSNVFSLMLGSNRKIKIEKIKRRKYENSSNIYDIKNGDGFYLCKKDNKNYNYSFPKIDNNKESINITFYINEPYSHRKYHLRYLNLLGYGKVPIWFEGTESEFPEDAVATIIPLSMMNTHTGGFMNRPYLDVENVEDLL